MMNDLVLKPTLGYWLTSKAFLVILIGLLFLVANLFYLNVYLKLLSGIIVLLCLSYSFYKYIEMMLFTKWIIGEEQIRINRGIFIRSVDYIELYRVYDYQQRQSFIQTMIGNVTFYIYSGDKSNPILKIYGIPASLNVIQEIRNRVELQKQKKGIYEFTNR